jgi:hypothetical protein
MAKHHIVLSEDDFTKLKNMTMMPLNELPIPDSEKSLLLEQARQSSGGASGGAQPERIPILVCGFVDDAVVCVHLPHPFPSP